MLGRLPIYALGGGFDPTTLALTAFHRNYTNPNWPGTASLGTSGSGSNDWNDPGNEPAQGTALNGWGTADFNGSDDFFDAEGTLDTYISSTALSFWALLNPDNNSSSQRIWRDSFTRCVISISAGNVSLTVGAGGTVVTHAISTGAYQLVTGRWNGSTLQIGVNEVPGVDGGSTSAALATPIDTLAGTITVGSTGAANFYNGHMAEFAMTDIALTDEQFNGVISYVNTRYALSLAP